LPEAVNKHTPRDDFPRKKRLSISWRKMMTARAREALRNLVRGDKGARQ